MLPLLLLTQTALAADPLAHVEQPAANLLARDARGLGIGATLGAPTGLSLAWRGDGKLSLASAFAWSFERPGVDLHGELRYDLSMQQSPDIPDTNFTLSVGAGPRIRLGDPPGDGSDANFDMGIRVPVTLSVAHEGFPLEGFLELAPGLEVVPETGFLLDGAVGARFYVPVSWTR